MTARKNYRREISCYVMKTLGAVRLVVPPNVNLMLHDVICRGEETTMIVRCTWLDAKRMGLTPVGKRK